jgi:bacterial/archaeal transporter family protein
MSVTSSWFFWAALSACFAALTAIFAKIGIQGIDSDFATLIRTVVILFVLAAFVWSAGKWSDPRALSPKTLLFLSLSALATGASWVCYFRALQIGEASKVAPVDKFSLVLVVVLAYLFLGERPSGREWLGINLVASGVLVPGFRRWQMSACSCLNPVPLSQRPDERWPGVRLSGYGAHCAGRWRRHRGPTAASGQAPRRH